MTIKNIYFFKELPLFFLSNYDNMHNSESCRLFIFDNAIGFGHDEIKAAFQKRRQSGDLKMNTICEQQIIRYIVAVSCIGYVRSSICFFEYKNI